MLRQRNQFDIYRTNSTAATPTCCCCCCCITTIAGSSLVLARKANRSERAKGSQTRWPLVTLASLYFPISLGLSMFGLAIYRPTSSQLLFVIIPTLIFSLTIFLFIYIRMGKPKPVLRALGFFGALVGMFFLEVVLALVLVVTTLGASPFIYVALCILALVQLWRYLHRPPSRKTPKDPKIVV